MTVASTHSPLMRRASLPLPTPYIAPSGELETAITRIFAEVFSLDQVGIDDEFFDLGGDSLLAEILSMRVSELASKDLRASSLLEYNSPRLIVRWLEDPAEEPVVSRQSDLRRIGENVRAITSDWGGERRNPDGLLLSHNAAGFDRPLFWCLQSRTELKALAAHVSPDLPLYGMSSGHLAMSPTIANTATLARCYIDEILTAEPMGPYVLGGNCRGGVVAAEIARQLQDSGREILLLTLLDVSLWEAFQGRSYPGKVAFLYGAYSRFNPYRRFRSPELGWRKLFPQGVRIELLPADHGQYFSKRVIPTLASKLRSALEWAEDTTPVASGGLGGRLPHAIYRAHLRTAESLAMRSGEISVVPVEVTNASQVTWPASAASGIALGNHWLTCQGEILIWGDGRTPLPASVPPGATATLKLQVRAPSDPGEYLLEIDLVEEGLAWFKERGSPAAIVPAIVSD